LSKGLSKGYPRREVRASTSGNVVNNLGRKPGTKGYTPERGKSAFGLAGFPLCRCRKAIPHMVRA